jgi:ParB family chromosome partitioning protein
VAAKRATASAESASPAKRKTASSPAKRRAARKAKAGSAGLDAHACVGPDVTESMGGLIAQIEAEGGVAVGAYREPLGGHGLALAVIPIDRIEPTPFQRDLSESHHKRLAEVIAKTDHFLDPIIAVTAPDGGFWTPNGRHRLEAMRRLGAKAITALVAPDRVIAWQILALNTEKAHNLKERSLEVIRIVHGLIAEDDSRPESSFAFYLEDASLVTLGVCYEKNPRFAGGAYSPVLRRTERFVDEPLADAIVRHEELAGAVLELERHVALAVDRLKQRGLTSPYLRSFVVSRINPLRWIKGEPPPAEKVIAQMRERASKFNVDRVKQDDLARMGGPPDDDAG